MTSKPKINRDLDVVSGLAALALFVVMAAVFLGASFDAPAGFEADASVTASLGYAMFNITGDFVPIAGEGLLAVFLIIALVLDAALEGSIMLARRDDGGTSAGPTATDGGTPARTVTDVGATTDSASAGRGSASTDSASAGRGSASTDSASAGREPAPTDRDSTGGDR